MAFANMYGHPANTGTAAELDKFMAELKKAPEEVLARGVAG